MSTKLVIANLKMNLESIAQRETYIAEAQQEWGSLPSDVEVVVCPSHAHLERFANALDDMTVALGAQDCFWELHGSYTGQVSPRTLKDFGVSHVILGHSEKRALGESNQKIAKKAALAARQAITPVICVGFSSDGNEEKAIQEQVSSVLSACAPEDRGGIVFAYEPVWAIGSGKIPTGQDIHTRVILIMRTLKGIEGAGDNLLLYGGSVRDTNVASIMSEGHVDGVLVGGASLRADEFGRIINNISQK